jgi:hypothetical protein
VARFCIARPQNSESDSIVKESKIIKEAKEEEEEEESKYKNTKLREQLAEVLQK